MFNKAKYYFLFFALVFNVAFYAQVSIIPDKPASKADQTAVYDYAHMLSSQEDSMLREKLIRYFDSTSTQIVVVTIESLDGYDIEDVAVKWAHKWGIGQAKEDNGLFILVAKKEHKIDIETGYGIEYLLTDGLAKRVIDRVIVPAFKRGNYYKGLDKGTDVIIDILAGEYQNNLPINQQNDDFPWGFVIIVIIWIIIIILAKNNKHRGGNNGNGRSISDTIFRSIILSGNGSSGGFGTGGFGGGSSGGGFGSGGFGGGFGGGGFGGGGASGSW